MKTIMREYYETAKNRFKALKYLPILLAAMLVRVVLTMPGRRIKVPFLFSEPVRYWLNRIWSG